MKLVVNRTQLKLGARVGPLCIACGNARRFWIEMEGREQLCELTDLPDGDVRIMACGRCSSRHSIVIANVD